MSCEGYLNFQTGREVVRGMENGRSGLHFRVIFHRSDERTACHPLLDALIELRRFLEIFCLLTYHHIITKFLSEKYFKTNLTQ